jgi:hypothetical protein
MSHMLRRKFSPAILLAAVLVLPACSSNTGQPVVPRVLSAHVSQMPNDPNYRHFVSNNDHRLILQTVNGNTAMRIVGQERTGPNDPVPLTLVTLDITVFSATVGPATYASPQGVAVMDVTGLNGTWSSQITGDFTLEVTQLDLGRNQASGNFRFVGKRSPNDAESLHVEEGAFLFLAIEDLR